MVMMKYPDGETLCYEYDSGGLLESVYGVTNSVKSVYVKNIDYDEFGSRTRIEYGNGAVSTLAYDSLMHRLTELKTTSGGSTLQNISYVYDKVGNITSRVNTDYVTTGTDAYTATQTYSYDALHRLETSTGRLLKGGLGGTEVNRYGNEFGYDVIGNITSKVQTNIANGTDVADKTYSWTYAYDGTRPHAVTSIGHKTFSYDLNGNTTQVKDSTAGTTRSISWDDDNRMTKVADSVTSGATTATGSTTTFAYDATGIRIVKSGNLGDVLYVNQNYSVRNNEIYSKHVFAGNTRIATKMIVAETNNGTTTRIERDTFYYAPDHLGSSSVVTTKAGSFYQGLEYFPGGSTWVEVKASATSEGTPYTFSAYEKDPETGYLVATHRTYDSEPQLWLSADPALPKYIPSANDFDTEHDYYWYLGQDASKKLPGIGGVFNSINLNVYHYAGNNPVKFVDPDGEAIFSIEFNPKSQYGSLTLVWNGVLPDGIFSSRTRADSGDPAVKSGVYNYKVSTHGPKYFAEHKALRINNDAAVPTNKPNPKHGGRNIATGVRAHVGNRMNNNNQGTTGSTACWTIPAVKGSNANYDPNDSSTWTNYNDFISSFKEGDTGKAFLFRTEDISKGLSSIKDAAKNLFRRDKK